MSKREKKLSNPAAMVRTKKPLNPSVLGTARQSARAEKGGRIGVRRQSEGRGHPPGGGRGGKVSRG